MDSYKTSAKRILKSYLAVEKNVFLICDEAYAGLAVEIQAGLGPGKAECRIAASKDTLSEAFRDCLKRDFATLVLLEPPTYAAFKAYKWLDFEKGEPKVRNLNSPSYVGILPLESALRIYCSDSQRDGKAKTGLLNSLKPNTEYVIRSCSGTELFFTARQWLKQRNEILTAPLEASVRGVIAVDGAFFFQRLATVVDFYIEAGELVKMQVRCEQDAYLLDLYRRMTENDFAKRQNRQLAEIGVGFNTGAVISDCFMESEMAYGTCHFCFGDNVCYGGENKSSFHGASVLITNPRFTKARLSKEVGSDN
ncbi:MAG TPA: hypothetical protein GX528_04990 [Firmicutes bacterium]|nr:hypothetical protein [Bacillota bacterium]